MSASAAPRCPIRCRVAPRLFQASAHSALTSIALSNSSSAPAKSARPCRDAPKAQWILPSLTPFTIVSWPDAGDTYQEEHAPHRERLPKLSILLATEGTASTKEQLLFYFSL